MLTHGRAWPPRPDRRRPGGGRGHRPRAWPRWCARRPPAAPWAAPAAIARKRLPHVRPARAQIETSLGWPAPALAQQLAHGQRPAATQLDRQQLWRVIAAADQPVAVGRHPGDGVDRRPLQHHHHQPRGVVCQAAHASVLERVHQPAACHPGSAARRGRVRSPAAGRGTRGSCARRCPRRRRGRPTRSARRPRPSPAAARPGRAGTRG